MLKERKIAIPLTAVVCVVFLLLGVGKGLRGQERQLAQMYETGTDGSGYGIATDLQKRYTYAGNLASVAQKYGDEFSAETAAVSTARAALNDALSTNDFGDDYDANAALTEAVESLNLAMQGNLSDADESYRVELYNDLSSRNDTISHAATDFNTAVRAYNSDILGGFPANVLHGLVGVETAEVFG
jgi:hypothetical protein